MSEHLDYFGLDRSPFADDAHAPVVIGTRALRKVVSRIQANLRDGAGRIGVQGVEGIGKTSLARALPKLFAGNTRTAAIFDPGVDWKSIRLELARDWQLSGEKLARAGLLQAARAQRLVLVVDRAERASEALLRHLDALQEIRDESGRSAVTVILFVKQEADTSAAKPAALEWLEASRAALVPFEPLAPDAVADYLERQLQRAGYRGSPLFTPRAALAIHTETDGIPGQIARLCERLLLEAAARRLRTLDEPFVRARNEPPPALAALAADPSEDAWDDSDHHPRETPDEELVLDRPVPGPSLSTAHVLAQADEPPSDPELEAYLSSPPTAAELRAIRGGFLRRNLWPFAAISCAAALGGLLLAGLLPDESLPDPSDTTHAALDASAALAAAGSPAPGASTAGPILGRLRGPVSSSALESSRKSSAAPRAKLDPGAPSASPLRRAGDFRDDAGTASRRPIVPDPPPLERDDRPSDLPPPAGLGSFLP